MVAACGVCLAGQAAAEPFSASSDLNTAAFAKRRTAVERTVEQPVARGHGREVYVYAGASGPEPRFHADPRWTPQNDPAQASNLVNTKLGVGWRKDGMETSFGYQVRQVKDAPMLFGEGPRKDAMLGMSLKFRR
jgi:hypothetical protein